MGSSQYRRKGRGYFQMFLVYLWTNWAMLRTTELNDYNPTSLYRKHGDYPSTAPQFHLDRVKQCNWIRQFPTPFLADRVTCFNCYLVTSCPCFLEARWFMDDGSTSCVFDRRVSLTTECPTHPFPGAFTLSVVAICSDSLTPITSIPFLISPFQ